MGAAGATRHDRLLRLVPAALRDGADGLRAGVLCAVLYAGATGLPAGHDVSGARSGLRSAATGSGPADLGSPLLLAGQLQLPVGRFRR